MGIPAFHEQLIQYYAPGHRDVMPHISERANCIRHQQRTHALLQNVAAAVIHLHTKDRISLGQCSHDNGTARLLSFESRTRNTDTRRFP